MVSAVLAQPEQVRSRLELTGAPALVRLRFRSQ
jgi:hypothetical protein